MKTKFIQDVITMLNQENTYRSPNGTMLDIAFLVAPIEENIGYAKEFMKDIETHEYDLRYFDDVTGGWTLGTILVGLVATDCAYEFTLKQGYSDNEPECTLSKIEYIDTFFFSGDYAEYEAKINGDNETYAKQRKLKELSDLKKQRDGLSKRIEELECEL